MSATRQRERPTLQWLGQAGYALTACDGSVCMIDPYLSNSAWDEGGVPRAVGVPVTPEALDVTVCVTTHWHGDHLDRQSCQLLLDAHPTMTFVGPAANTHRLKRMWNVPSNQVVTVDRQQTTRVGPFEIAAHFARHEVPGFLCEDAVTLTVECDGVRVFHSGDTEYDTRIRAAGLTGPIDVGLFSINGTGGNMNAMEAALLAHQLAPRLSIPMHYGMWPDEFYGGLDANSFERQTLDPGLFVSTLSSLGDHRSYVMAHGETIVLDRFGQKQSLQDIG